jgi:hypothetical protein
MQMDGKKNNYFSISAKKIIYLHGKDYNIMD